MCQHSWYDKRNKRHYGPKPNTRRARGLRRRDAGIKRGPVAYRSNNNIPSTGIDREVESVPMPRTKKELKQLIFLYNYYVQDYDKYHDREICIVDTMTKFETTREQVEKAIKVCKCILASGAE